ncbi:unnamed protein product [Anisakis simplex]|uniref:Transmembrane protein 254 n=1 Tax=Anisakis simplex TaxID=6269 RepID=A0A0M3IYJ2_ANISI|nr:unnamed protein product [Anisakis simplex]
MSYVGVLAHYLGTNHPRVMLILNVLMFMAHMGEALYAKRLAQRSDLSPTCIGKWYAQTFLLGYPSLRLLLNYKKRST